MEGSGIRTGRIDSGGRVSDLGDGTLLGGILESGDPLSALAALDEGASHRVEDLALLAPVGDQPVWAAGVTYQRSRKARMDESDFAAAAYERVYQAPRPELFLKALPGQAVGPGEPVGIRRDSRWNVPEPELALVFGPGGALAGCTIGNDMSSRDIEGENPLYLPQAKLYRRSCALGPWVALGADEEEMRGWEIRLSIVRRGREAFGGSVRVDRIVRPFQQLAGYLFRSQDLPRGAVLLTGTGIVPGDGFTLEEGDRVDIGISGIGTLSNPVAWV